MDKNNKNQNQRFPFYILWLIPFYIVNFLLLFLIQYVFIYTEKGPLNEETIKEVAFFEDAKIIDIDNYREHAADGIECTTPAFVLYQTEENEIKIVRIKWHRFAFRYRIEKNTVQTITPVAGETTVTMKILAGEERIIIRDGIEIARVETIGGLTNNVNQHPRYFIPFIPMIIEYLIYALIFKKKRVKE